MGRDRAAGGRGFDAGEVLATRTFPMREDGKASIYRHEVRRAAIEALFDAVDEITGATEPREHGASRHRAVAHGR